MKSKLLIVCVAAFVGACTATNSKELSSAVASDPNAACLEKAYSAAHAEYSDNYPSDWAVAMSAIVSDGKIETVDVTLSPYDGSVGGGIRSEYDCSTGVLSFTEQLR